MKTKFQIHKNTTLHQWFKEFIPHLSYQLIHAALRRKDIILRRPDKRADTSINMITMRLLPRDAVKIGDEVHVWDVLLNNTNLSDRSNIHLTKGIHLNVIDENENYIVIDKPVGIPTQGGSKIRFSLVDILKNEYSIAKPYILHRLDKDVSGLLVVGKNAETARVLSESLRNMQWSKKYIALLDTFKVPIPKFGNIIDTIDDKFAKTSYKFLDIHPKGIMVELNPMTGRKHQLRIHCNKHLNPIVGDQKYGNWHKKNYTVHNQGIYLRCIYLKFIFQNRTRVYKLANSFTY